MEASGVQESLREAYTAIADHLGAEFNPHAASESAIDVEHEDEPEVIRCGRQ